MNMHSKVPAPGDSSVLDAPQGLAERLGRWSKPAFGALLAIAVGLGAWYFFGKKDAPPAPPQAAPVVTVSVPGTTMVASTVRGTGSIAARRDMPVGVQGEGGRVTSVLVDAGQFVRAGQVLATIDKAVQTQQLAQMQAGSRSARADAALAQAELDRAQALVSKGFISKADIDRKTAARDAAQARVAVATAQASEMEARLGRLDVRAPAAGLVLARSVEAGQVVGAGSPPLFRVAEGGVLELRAAVTEQDMERLKVGMPASVRPIGADSSYQGKVWLLDPVIDATSRQGIARIALPYSPGLRVGAFAAADIAAGEATQPVLPQSAVQVDGEGSYVLIVGKDNIVARRAIKTGTVSDSGVSINSGLSGDERVVLNAAAFLRPGDKITPVAAPKR